MPSIDTQWFPFLGDAVAVRTSAGDTTGTATRYDSTLVELAGTAKVQVGEVVEAAWRVGADVHRGSAVVLEVNAHGFSVRLQPAAAEVSRREHERLTFSVPVVVVPHHSGSYGAVPIQARTLDLSNGGMRALVDSDEGFGIGQVVEVQVELDGMVHTLTASVVWQAGHGPGELMTGLHFLSEVEASSWMSLSSTA